MLEAKHLRLTYSATVALADASATVVPGEVVALTGPSGSGKSSLLYCMSAIIRPDEGEVTFDGVRLDNVSETGRSRVRREHFGFVFQFAELVPELSLRDNVMLPLEITGVGVREARARADDLLERLGIASEAARRPAQVSGGQAQRAAVARALVHRPRVVFADEPTVSLDSANAQLVIDSLLTMARDNGTAVLVATHDADVAARADRTVRVADGRAPLIAEQPA